MDKRIYDQSGGRRANLLRFRRSPGDVAELHGDALRHAPLLREHAPVLLLVVHQLTLDPSVAPVDLIQPRHLKEDREQHP